MPVAELDPAVLRLRDLSSEAVWTLSTCKQGFGVQQLLDRRTTTYWQSDGPQPHMIDIQFLRRTAVHVRRLDNAYGQPGRSDEPGDVGSERRKRQGSKKAGEKLGATLSDQRGQLTSQLWTWAKGCITAHEDGSCVTSA